MKDIIFGGMCTKFKFVENCKSIRCCNFKEEVDLQPMYTKNWDLSCLDGNWKPQAAPPDIQKLWKKKRRYNKK